MSVYRPVKRPANGVRRGVAISRPHAHHSSHVLRVGGQAELVKKSVEYREPTTSRKRARPASPELETMDIDWIDVPMKDTTSSLSISHIIDTYTNPVPGECVPTADCAAQTVQSGLTTSETQANSGGKAQKVRLPTVLVIRRRTQP